jgi:hypothetical protein
LRHGHISAGVLKEHPSEVLTVPLPGVAGESVPEERRVKESALAIDRLLSWRTAMLREVQVIGPVHRPIRTRYVFVGKVIQWITLSKTKTSL